MTREDLEHLTDEQMDRWMADDDRMADSQLLAGYREATFRARGRRPDHDRMWNNIAQRTTGSRRPEETPSAPDAAMRRIVPYGRIAAWVAAAAAVILLTWMPVRRFLHSGNADGPASKTVTDRQETVVASVPKIVPSDVVIYTDGRIEKAADRPAQSPGAAVTEREADFSKSDIGDITATKTVVIPRGRLYKVTLSDGSEVWLNADSRLVFPARFSGARRRVELEGEAYFKVAKDASHPFIVKAGNVSTVVLGTEFNVRSYVNEAPEVALVEGSVVVNDCRSSRTVKLIPGQAAVVAKEKIAVNRINTDYYKQWKEGLFYFDNASLLDVMKELGRWYNIGIEIEDPSLARYNIHFIGSRDDRLEQIVSDLNFFSYLNVSKKGEKLIISRKKQGK